MGKYTGNANQNTVSSPRDQDTNATIRKSFSDLIGRAKDKLRSPHGHRRNRSTEIAGYEDMMNDSKSGVTLTKFEVVGSVRSPSASPTSTLSRRKASRKADHKVRTLLSSESNPGPINNALLHPHWSEKAGASTLPFPEKKHPKIATEKQRKHSAPPEVMRRDIEGAIGAQFDQLHIPKEDARRGQLVDQGSYSRDHSPVPPSDSATLLLNERNLLMNCRREERIASTAPDCCSIETASDSVRNRPSRTSFYKSSSSCEKLKRKNVQNLLIMNEMKEESTDSKLTDSLSEEGEEEQFVEVFLTSEAFSRETSNDVGLGGVPFRAYKGTLAQLREQMYLSLCALPVEFSFVTKNGTSILKSQEPSLKVSHVWDGQTHIIRIQRNFGKPRFGLATYDNRPIGFVFAEYNQPISTLRKIVKQQLGEIGSPPTGLGYQFMDRNGWPLSRDQENRLNIVDCMLNGVVKVCPPVFESSASSVPALMDKIHEKKAIESIPEKRKKTVILPAEHHRREGRLREKRSVSIRASIGPDGFEPKQILISYVRAEAAQYALRLKELLTDEGFSVYLDVHEIKSGKDWQDALNYAVSNCEVFIPLVTPRYGETRWTNREVKLADVLQKLIIPISFVETWPPKCLAIQFATTQYIPSGPITEESEDDESDLDPTWTRSMARVAEQVGARVKEADRQAKLGRIRLTKRNSVLKSYAGPPLPPDFKQLSDELSADRPGVPLVVISVHPEQRNIGNQLKNVLEEEGYEVWCTTELLTGAENGFTFAQTQQSIESNTSSETGSAESGSQETASICLNQLSQMSRLSTEDAVTPDSQITEMNLKFQQKADEAGLVLFVLSEAFANSKTCKQHVFYCEHRKRVIPVRFDEFPMPTWMSMLIGTGVLEDATKEGYEETLLARVKAMLDKTARGDGLIDANEVDEEKINKIKQLKEELPKRVYVYVAGSTKFYNDKSEEICKKIGKHLAHVEDVHMVTGGFYGAGDVVGRSFYEERKYMDESPNVWHVLPTKDDRDRSHQSLQNKDLTFQRLEYGDTVFIGECVREREVIVSRVFDICILVEGGPGAAHEAEQFTWSDHVVIPVSSTGGAASGLFNVPDKIFRVPEGAQEGDYKVLSDSDASSEDIAQSLKRIVRGVRDKLYLDSPSAQGPLHSPLKSPRSLASQRTALSRMKTFQFSSTVDED